MHGAQFIWPLVVLTLSGVLLLISLFLFRLKKHLIEKEVELRNLIIKMHQAQSELNEYKNMVDEEILRDSVTGLSSFTVFKEHMQQVLEQSAARRMVFGLLLLDIRNFSIINSTLGYHMGDLVLKEVANKLQACIRQTDGACRFSGDIFIILLSKLNHADSAILIVQRIFQKLAEPFVVNGHSLALQANIGIVTYPADGHNVDTLLQKAANALSQAKAIGAQHFQFYQDEMQNQSQRELVLNSALALDSVFNEFSIEYQP
ncbi:MAG TPA: GGDEF domain-containing protein, partial [Gammaproteobacteria bacterium]|nr:GGDEF domain-containing protein [Gammaproteobacteria bacterium]